MTTRAEQLRQIEERSVKGTYDPSAASIRPNKPKVAKKKKKPPTNPQSVIRRGINAIKRRFSSKDG